MKVIIVLVSALAALRLANAAKDATFSATLGARNNVTTLDGKERLNKSKKSV